MDIPKIIWIYWDQGWNNAPLLVQKCKQSWIIKNPEYEIRSLDHNVFNDDTIFAPFEKEIISSVISTFTTTDTMLCMNKSWLLRFFLLKKFGGIWVDATVYAVKPLRDWLYTNMNSDYYLILKPQINTYKFEHNLIDINNNNTDVSLYFGGNLCSWFIVANNNSYMAKKLYDLTLELLNARPNNLPYFAPHFIYAYLYHNDTEFKQQYNKINSNDEQHISFIHTHSVQYGYISNAPIQKLQWKNGWNQENILSNNEILQELFTEH